MLVRAVELSPRAERHLAAIEAYYLKEAGPAVADRAVASIIQVKCEPGPILHVTRLAPVA